MRSPEPFQLLLLRPSAPLPPHPLRPSSSSPLPLCLSLYSTRSVPAVWWSRGRGASPATPSTLFSLSPTLSTHATPLLLLLVVRPNGAAARIPLSPPWSAFAPPLTQGKLLSSASPPSAASPSPAPHSLSLPDPPPAGRRSSVGVAGVEIRQGPSRVAG